MSAYELRQSYIDEITKNARTADKGAGTRTLISARSISESAQALCLSDFRRLAAFHGALSHEDRNIIVAHWLHAVVKHLELKRTGTGTKSFRNTFTEILKKLTQEGVVVMGGTEEIIPAMSTVIYDDRGALRSADDAAKKLQSRVTKGKISIGFTAQLAMLRQQLEVSAAREEKAKQVKKRKPAAAKVPLLSLEESLGTGSAPGVSDTDSPPAKTKRARRVAAPDTPPLEAAKDYLSSLAGEGAALLDAVIQMETAKRATTGQIVEDLEEEDFFARAMRATTAPKINRAEVIRFLKTFLMAAKNDTERQVHFKTIGKLLDEVAPRKNQAGNPALAMVGSAASKASDHTAPSL